MYWAISPCSLGAAHCKMSWPWNFSKLSFLQKSTTHHPTTSDHLLKGFSMRCLLTKDIDVNYRRQQLCTHSCGWEKVQWATCSVAFLYIERYCIWDLNGMGTAAMHQTLGCVPALPDCTGQKLLINTCQVQDSTQAAEKNWDHSFPTCRMPSDIESSYPTTVLLKMTKSEDEDQAALPDPAEITTEHYILYFISNGTANTGQWEVESLLRAGDPARTDERHILTV